MRISTCWKRVLVGAGVALSLSGLAVAPAAAATLQVAAVDNAFDPRPITVAVGDTIVWTNSGQRPHTVTADNGSFDSGTFTNGQTFSRAFSTPGTFAYYCTIHGGPGGQGMAGTITVTAAEVTTTTAAPAQVTTTPPTAVPITVAPTASPTVAPRAASPTTVPARVASAAPTTAPAAPAAVAAQPPTAPAVPLARTGASSFALALIGAGILLMGVACVMGTRPEPPELSPG